MSDHTEPVKRPLEPNDLAWLTDRASVHQEAIADAMGLNPTDLRCARLAWIEPGMTPGRLAEITGLTSGAVTGVLDRLEKARLAYREPDPVDRRRTLIRLNHERGAELAAIYDPLEAVIRAILDGYDARQLATLGDFVRRAGDAMEHDAARLRATSHGGMVGEMFTAPLGSATLGRLTFKSGAPRFMVRAGRLGPSAEARMVAELTHTSLELGGVTRPDELCRATFTGPLPDTRARDGDISMQYKRRPDPRQRSAHVALNPAVPWAIEISGGLSRLDADLRGRRLRDLDISGGLDDVTLQLSEPDGTSRIRITGNSRDVDITHPRGTALRMSISGGVQEVAFEDQRLRQVQGKLRLETRAAARAADRFEVELTGGARTVRVHTA
jgi:DNA-binding MarR family transcriptional regulator